MDLDNLNIRKANSNDIYQIVNIKVNGWQSAYVDILDSSILNNMSIDKEITSYINKYSLNDVLVAELNGEILGFCRVYDYKLFSYVLNYFKSKEKKELYLGVFEKNYKSRKFYEKMGGILGNKDILKINNKDYPVVSYIYNLVK